MKILIVDDEPLAISRLKRLLNTLHYTDIVEASSAHEALNKIGQEHFETAFLDISMEQMNGIELGHALRSGREDLAIIYQTAHENYALHAFRVGAVDYLLKPYTLDMLREALNRIKSIKPQETRFIAKTGDSHRLIKPEEIVYIQADLNEVIFRTVEEFCYYPKKISDLETLLVEHSFFRVHRSYLINMNAIESMEMIDQSRIRFMFRGVKEYIDSSKEGAKNFREKYKAHK